MVLGWRGFFDKRWGLMGYNTSLVRVVVWGSIH
jgi:hypothetical protein